MPKGAKVVQIRKWSLGKHISVLGVVSATGKTFPPSIVVEASALKSSWCKSFPEASWGVDSAGYFSEGPFFDAMVKFVKDSEPVGGAADNPRLLYMDNYRSHLDASVLKLLRAHNVRVVTFHPHTTHIFCVLDTSIFATFKRVLKSFFDDDMRTITMDNVGECVKLAWKEATKLTVDAMTGEVESAASKGFKSAGLVPFDRSIVDSVVSGKHAAIAKIFEGVKAETAAAGGAVPPVAKSIRLTDEEKKAIIDDFVKQHLEVVGYAATPYNEAKNRPKKALSQLASGASFIAEVEAKEAAKIEEVALKDARKVAREEKKAAKAVEMAAKTAAAVAAAADATAAATAKPAKPKPKPKPPTQAQVAAAPVKRVRAPEGDEYARAYKKTRR